MTPNDWWAGTSEEFMDIGGPYESREQAIKEGRGHQLGDPFWICRAKLEEWSPPDAEEVIEKMCENADEYFYDDGFTGFEGAPQTEKAMEKDLQAVLNQWFDRWEHIFPQPTAFSNASVAEQIDAPVVTQEIIHDD